MKTLKEIIAKLPPDRRARVEARVLRLMEKIERDIKREEAKIRQYGDKD